MSKPKFDPSRIQERSPSGGLEPLDFMRPMAKEESTTKPEPEATSKPETRKTDVLPKVETDLRMPPARKVEPRVMLVCRITPELDRRLRRFCQAHDASMQDTVTLAVDEFLERRKA